MKCDVCGTTIPLGSNRCPNCGYKIPTTKGIHTSTLKEYDDSSTFDHIQPVHKKTVLNDMARIKPLKKVNTNTRRRKSFSFGSIIAGIVIFLVIYTGAAYLIPLYQAQEYFPTLTDLSMNIDSLEDVDLTNPNLDRTMFQSYSLAFNDELDNDPKYFPLGMKLYMVPSGLPAKVFASTMRFENLVYSGDGYNMYYNEYGDYNYSGVLYENEDLTIYYTYYNNDETFNYDYYNIEEGLSELHDLMVVKIENGYTTE